MSTYERLVNSQNFFSPYLTQEDLFRFRRIPELKITTDHILMTSGETFDITSVEDVKGRGMYVEVLAKKVVSTVGKS